MSNILYKELLIVDKKEKKARKICFKEGVNIITSKENSVGKTSLSLMLLYSFGAKVKFSDKWNLDNIFTKLTIQNGDKKIAIIRFKNTYTIKTPTEKFFYPIQTKGYSDKLYELLGLSIKIKDKNSDTFSTAVPSLYLLPYFLAQTNSDTERTVFEDLSMYSKNDLRDALYYHVGALDNNYSYIVNQLTKIKLELDQLKQSKENQLLEIQYLEKKLNEHKNVKLIDNDIDLKSDIDLYQRYSDVNNKYYLLIKQKTNLKNKITLLGNALKDNEIYSEKLLNNEEILCPVCKSDITGFISSALAVGLAESEINTEIAELKASLLNTKRSLMQTKSKLDELHNKVMQTEKLRENIKITRAIIVWNEQLQIAKQNFAESQLKIENYEKMLKEFNSVLKTYSEKKKLADSAYRNAFSTMLDITNVDKKEINLNSMNLYDSPSLSGSEIPRIAISRFFALLESKNIESIVMPIIFDFPNLDMNEENLKRCFSVICDKIKDTKKYPQSMLFSIDCLERITNSGHTYNNSNIIDMAKLPVDNLIHPQLLCTKDFIEYSNEINEMLRE